MAIIPHPTEAPMKLADFQPGLRVYLLFKGAHIHGTVGRAWGPDTVDIFVQFDDGGRVLINSEQVAEHFHLAISN